MTENKPFRAQPCNRIERDDCGEVTFTLKTYKKGCDRDDADQDHIGYHQKDVLRERADTETLGVSYREALQKLHGHKKEIISLRAWNRRIRKIAEGKLVNSVKLSKALARAEEAEKNLEEEAKHSTILFRKLEVERGRVRDCASLLASSDAARQKLEEGIKESQFALHEAYDKSRWAKVANVLADLNKMLAGGGKEGKKE